MAIENAVIYVLTELPTLVMAKVLQRSFAWAPRRAKRVATLLLMSIAFGAFLLAWCSYEMEVTRGRTFSGEFRVGFKAALHRAVASHFDEHMRALHGCTKN